MNYSDVIRIVSGLLQLAVAGYALRLGLRFNAARVGWLLFSGLSLLGLVYLLLPLNPFRSTIQLGLKGDIIYGLTSSLLLVSMIYLDLRFKKRVLAETAERQSLSEWESEVKEKIEAAGKVNEALQQTVARLEVEMSEKKLSIEQEERAYQEQLLNARQIEEELRQTMNRLETEIIGQKQALELSESSHQEQLAAAYQSGITAGKVELASSLFQTFSTARASLDSVGLAADELSRSRLAPLARLAGLIGDHAREIRSLARSAPRNLPLAERLVQLAQQLTAEQVRILKKVDVLRKKLRSGRQALQPGLDQLSAILGTAGVEAPADGSLPIQTAELAGAEPTPDSEALPTVELSTLQPAATGNIQELFLSNLTQTGTQPATTDVTALVEPGADLTAEQVETSAGA